MISMSLRPAVRIPRRFVRPVSKRTQSVVARRHGRALGDRMNRKWRWWSRGIQRNVLGWKRAFLRWIVVALLGLTILTIAIVFFSPIGKVEEIRVVRTDPRLDIEEVIQTLSPLFGRYLVGISTREVKIMLDDRFQDIASVDVNKRYPSQLLLRITLDPIVARLRILDPTQPKAGSGVMLGSLTDRGIFTLTEGPSGSGALAIIDVTDWAVRPEPGVYLLPPAFLRQITEAEAILRTQFGQTVTRRVAYLRAQEFHFAVQNVSLWFDVRSPLESQLQRYRTFLQSVGLQTAKEYVDLRIADKVIYR